MKKTTNYLIREYRFMATLVCIGLLGILPMLAYGQVPSCSKFSVGINASGESIITAAELLNNKPKLPAYLLIKSAESVTVYEGEITDLQASIKLDLCSYVNKSLYFEIKNSTGFCSDTLHVSIPPSPVMNGRKIHVMCGDPLTIPKTLIGDTFPSFQYPCAPKPQLKVSEDFQQTNDCTDYSEAVGQIIYREIEGYDNWGQRFTAIDTIVVYKHPEVTANHIELDTIYNLYCGASSSIGPRIIYRNPVNGQFDTISLLKTKSAPGRLIDFEAASVPGECNMDVTVSSAITNYTKCEKQYQINMEVSQDCYFSDGTTPIQNISGKGLLKMEDGRYRLSFSVLDRDTLAPVITLDQQIVTSYTSSQKCEAPLIIPHVTIKEECSGIRRVQASAPGFFTVNMKQDRNGSWVPDEKVYLPKDGMDYMEMDTMIENAFKVYIEASDSCDLVSRDSFYIQVEDNTNPTVSLLKNIRVGLTGQLTWLDVSIMNEDSYDNCGVAKVFGRRIDWATAGSVNLCDGLESDSRINPVEAYYVSFLQDLKDGNQSCGEWLYDEWMKDSIKYCQGDLPANMQAEVGGGWTTQIPFTCEDACKDIEVELLVIDNWCNWNTTRSTVKVRDKQPISIVQDLESNISMNCSSYSRYYTNIVTNALNHNNLPASDPNRIQAFSSLDSVLGGYVSVWQDLDGRMTTNDGQNVIPSEHNVTIRKDECENYTERKSVEVFDENSGQFVSRIQNVPAIRAVPASEKVENGIVAVNCSSSTYQKISVNIDDCGAGIIRRQFFVAGGCGEMSGDGDWMARNEDRIEFTREQVIRIEPDCPLSAGMLDMPLAVSALDVCNIEKNTNGNYAGELHPDFTGWPKFTWSQNCRNLTVGYQDKLYRLVGNNPIGQWKLVRNWHISDKCDPSEDGAVLHYEQLIILNEVEDCDTAKNQFLISGQVMDPEGVPIQNVAIRLQTETEESVAAHTSIQGTYSISADKHMMYRVIPYKNDEMLRGISTFDLVMIQKDILNIKRLDNVYRRIAADVNGNGLIEAIDVLELRKAILRPDFKFANNTSYQFREAGSNANFTEIINLDKNTEADFVAIKIGDVNFSASSAAPTSRRSGMNMILQDQWLREDVRYRIPVRNGREMSILGFQFEWDLNEQDISSVALEPGNVNISSEEYALLEEGKLTVSWFDVEERYFEEDEVLFYVTLKTNRKTTLKNIIGPSATILNTESYVEPGIVQGLQLTFRNMERSIGHIQNSPNPFRDRTIIHFDKQNEGPVSLHIFDITGKLVLHNRLKAYKGKNEITISGSQLPGPGMYYYRIKGKDELWTNKMIYIR